MNSFRRNCRLALVILVAWLLPALACNFPMRSRQIRTIVEESLRQTLTALPSPTLQSETQVTGAVTSTAGPPFPGLQTATPGQPAPAVTPVPGVGGAGPFYQYTAQSGDTLPSIAARFGVELEQIVYDGSFNVEGLLPPGLPLTIPNVLEPNPYANALLPDSEMIHSPSTVDFQTHLFIQEAGGYLSSYGEEVDGEWMSGADIVQRVAVETSTNPRLLLALLEYQSHWVLGQPDDLISTSYPIGFNVPGEKGLYKELVIVAKLAAMGYYGWRAGTLTELVFPDGIQLRLSPGLNAGSAALQFLFSRLYRQAGWISSLYDPRDFLTLHQQMFGDPWARAAAVEPLFQDGLAQPPLELPFPPGESWSFSGGPHYAWTTGSPRGALDFSPVTGGPACTVSSAWTTAAAPGLVARASHNVVVVDLDGDGFEQTGWALVYLHVAGEGMALPGTWVELDSPIGHPSCERGKSTGTHVHIARKYNGEWIDADGPLPFVLSGWEVHIGSRIYEGYLIRGEEMVSANPGGSRTSLVSR